jgi:hypothetical protein
MTTPEATRPGAVVVKELEWVQHPSGKDLWRAQAPHIGWYGASAIISPASWQFDGLDEMFTLDAENLEAAKAAAQADYTRRILSALELKPVAGAVTEAMTDLLKRARIKAGMLMMGEKIAFGSDATIIEELCAALEAALQSGGAAGEPPAQPAGEGEADPSFADALPDEQIRIWINACNHEPARQALRQLLAYRVRGVSAPLKREMLSPQRFGLVADADGNAMWPVLAGEWVRYDDYVAALTTPQAPVAHVEEAAKDLPRQDFHFAQPI